MLNRLIFDWLSLKFEYLIKVLSGSNNVTKTNNGVSVVKQAFGMEPKYFKCHMATKKGNNQKKTNNKISPFYSLGSHNNLDWNIWSLIFGSLHPNIHDLISQSVIIFDTTYLFIIFIILSYTQIEIAMLIKGSRSYG